jgi:hypothetical protein
LAITILLGASTRATNLRGAAVPDSGTGALWAPDKHLIAIVIQDPHGIRLLRHVQGLEEGQSSHFRVLQIRCVMFNPIQDRMSFVCSTHAKELNNLVRLRLAQNRDISIVSREKGLQNR